MKRRLTARLWKVGLIGPVIVAFAGTMATVQAQPAARTHAAALLLVTIAPCPGGKVSSKPQSMPFWVFNGKHPELNHFCPSGYMGDVRDISMQTSSVITVTYTFSGKKGPHVCGYTPCGWAGVYWLNPEGNSWASKPREGYNLARAGHLLFRARSTHGAVVEFKVGGVATGKYPSSLVPARSTGTVTLTSQWKGYSIPLAGSKLSYVIDGFAWVTSWANNPGKTGIKFQIADIRFEA